MAKYRANNIVFFLSPGPLHFYKCTNTALKKDSVHKILELMDEFPLAFALVASKGKHIISTFHLSNPIRC